MSDDELCSEEYKIDKDAEELLGDALGEHIAGAVHDSIVRRAKARLNTALSCELYRLQAAVAMLQWANCAMPDSEVGDSELKAMMGIVKRVNSAVGDVVKASVDLKGIVDGKEESESQ